MPHYDYLCESGHEFEVEQPIKDDALTVCTVKGVDHNGDEVECCSPCKRQLCKSSFSLKGGGWSNDGYAKKGN
jgi:predicted nucleic acid-binding Zn ribbon protein